MNSDTAPKFTDVRATVVLFIMTLFAFAFVASMFFTVPKENKDIFETFQGALMTAFAAAWGYYLGNSSGASMAREQVGKALDLAQNPTQGGQQPPSTEKAQ